MSCRVIGQFVFDTPVKNRHKYGVVEFIRLHILNTSIYISRSVRATHADFSWANIWQDPFHNNPAY